MASYGGGTGNIPPPRDRNASHCANQHQDKRVQATYRCTPSPHTLYAIPRATPSPSRTSPPVLGSTFLPSPPVRRSTSRSSPSWWTWRRSRRCSKRILECHAGWRWRPSDSRNTAAWWYGPSWCCHHETVCKQRRNTVTTTNDLRTYLNCDRLFFVTKLRSSYYDPCDRGIPCDHLIHRSFNHILQTP